MIIRSTCICFSIFFFSFHFLLRHFYSSDFSAKISFEANNLQHQGFNFFRIYSSSHSLSLFPVLPACNLIRCMWSCIQELLVTQANRNSNVGFTSRFFPLPILFIFSFSAKQPYIKFLQHSPKKFHNFFFSLFSTATSSSARSSMS